MNDYEIRKARDAEIAQLITEFEAKYGAWDK